MPFLIRFVLALLLMGAGAAQAADVRLRLMATTDLHMNLLPHDYYQDRATNRFGFALTMALIEQARQEAPNHLLFDNGDLLQGSAMGDVVAAGGATNDHPAYRLLRAAGFDAASLGNHEFNFGLPFLQAAVKGAGFPVLSANVVWPKTQKPVFAPSAMLTRRVVDAQGKRHRLRIGVLGLTPPQIMVWDHQHLAGRVEALDMTSVARDEVAALRRRGADLVVVLAHTGLDATGNRPTEHAGQHLARIPGVDALILGHAHAELPGPSYAGLAGVDAEKGRVHGVPAVMAGRWGDHLGVIDLRLTRERQGRWRVAESSAHLRKVGTQKSDLPERLVGAEHRATLARMQATVAHTTLPLHSHLSQVQDSLSVELVARAQAWRTAQLVQGTPWQDVPLLSAAAPFRAGGHQGPTGYTDIPVGPITRRHVADLYVYPNTLAVVQVTGAELREWLERSAGQFRRIDPAGPPQQTLLASDHPAFNFDVVEGVQYEIDVTQPRRYDNQGALVAPQSHRIVNLRWQGQPVRDDQSFLVATNSYRASGGGHFPGTGPQKVVLRSEEDVREIVERYLVHTGEVRTPEDGNWQLRPVPGVTLQLRSGPAAKNWVRAPWRWTGDQADGWAAFELSAAP